MQTSSLSIIRRTGIYHGGCDVRVGIGIGIRRSFDLLTVSARRDNPDVSRKPQPSKNMLRAKHIGKDYSSLAPVLSLDHNPSLSESQAVGTVATAQANFMRVVVQDDSGAVEGGEGDDRSSSKNGFELLCVVRAVLKKIRRRVQVGDKVLVLPLSNHRLKLTCAGLSPPVWKQSRRVISVSVSVFLSRFLLLPNDAIAGSFVDKYVQRKKLDPLEAYVPPVILAQLQIQDLEQFLNVEKPEFEACRSLLRSGPASSLRVNIRAVAQYASDAGYSETASADVDRCLRALEEMDSLFLRASRKDPNATVELMKSQLGTVLTALDSILQTVPSQVLDKGKAMVEVYRSPSEEDDVSDSAEIQQLQSIL